MPDSQRPFAIMMGSEFQAAWGELLYSLRTGEPGFEKRFGIPFFQYMMEHPDRHSFYDQAMGTFGREETSPVLDAYNFGTFRTVVDLGGGRGVLLASILKRYPAVRGILFDLPAVAERARDLIAGMDLSDRCRTEGGNFFTAVPSGADAYLMQHVIHDWQDTEAIAILRNCRQAMAPGGRILLIEMIIPPGNEPSFGKWLDLMMLLVGGKERTQEQYQLLLSKAGLHLNRIIPTTAEISIVEAMDEA